MGKQLTPFKTLVLEVRVSSPAKKKETLFHFVSLYSGPVVQMLDNPI